MARPTLTLLTLNPNAAGWDSTFMTNVNNIKAFVATNPVAPGLFTTTTLPAAASYDACIAAVSNPAVGKSKIVYSNGTNWLYLDGTTV